jgi:hypothetical protein
MTSQKVLWARKQFSSRLKGVKSKTERTRIFKKVWAEAKKKFG